MEKVSVKTKISKVLLKVIIVNVLNLIVLALVMFLLPQIAQKAVSVKTLRSNSIVASRTIDSSVLKADIERQKPTLDALNNALSGGDPTVISFIQQMDQVKKNGVVTGYEFPITVKIPDKIGGIGLPVAITLKGSREGINQALISIDKFPLIFKPINLSISFNASQSAEINAKYGGFLYVQ